MNPLVKQEKAQIFYPSGLETIRWGANLSREVVEFKKLVSSPNPKKNKRFVWGIPKKSPGYLGPSSVLQKFVPKKKVSVHSPAPILLFALNGQIML